MANALQRQAVRRKVTYALVIVGLFTLSIFWRGKLAVPFSAPDNAAARLSQASVLGRAETLELRELDQGDPEILGTVLKLTTFGFRGAAITGLWWGALEKQKRHEYHEFEVLVQAVTRLQPNFITPWLYQSWNLTYNVSVEHDKLGDMYFYIARGISLLAEGDRVNTRVVKDPAGRKADKRVGSPDLRYNIGIYYQNKFSVSDKVNTLRSLMQVSAIPPRDRRRETFDAGGQGIDPAAFAKFCRDNPQLVRRLRYKLRYTRPADIVDFLADNDKVPSIYRPDSDAALEEPLDRFPIFPDQFASDDIVNPSTPLNDTFDAFDAARAWFAYSLTSVPPPKTDRNKEPLPWSAPQPGEYDAFEYRVPRAPALIVFRQAAPRAQTYLAERLTTEGWFDRQTVWNPNEPGWPSDLTTARSAQDEWQKAAALWEEHGQANALILSPERRATLEAIASGRAAGGEKPTPADQRETIEALRFLQSNMSVTNFQYFLSGAKAEGQPLTVQARKLLYEATQAAESGGNRQAADLYRQALAKWRQALAEYPDFHHPYGPNDTRTTTTEENTYEYEVALVKLLRVRPEVTKRAADLASRPGSPGLSAAVLGPLAAASEVQKDYEQAAAEDEAGLEIAVESVLSDDPILRPQAGTPRAQALQEVNKRFEAKPKAEQTPAARRQIARTVVNERFAWMKEFKYEPKVPEADGSPERAAYWVHPEVRSIVRERMQLVRRRPPEPSDAPPAEAGAGR